MDVSISDFRTKEPEIKRLMYYFLLTFGLTWLLAVLLGILDPQTSNGLTGSSILILLLVGLPAAFGPTLAAFIISALTEGKSGVKSLWKRFWNRNVTLKWLLVILLFYQVFRLLANLTAQIADGQSYFLIDTTTPLWMVVPLFIQSFLLSGLGEEFGWRGYALPRLQARWNPLSSSIILGIIWASWHIPFFFIHNQPLYQRNFWEWVPLILLSSVIYTWIFNNTRGSVLGAALIHASLNTSIIVLPTQTSLWYYYAILLISVILIIIFFGPKSLVRLKSDEMKM